MHYPSCPDQLLLSEPYEPDAERLKYLLSYILGWVQEQAQPAEKDSNEWLLHWRTPSHHNVCCCLNLKWRHVKRAFSHESLAPLCTRTTISRLISCESCSLETLNHSFSVLSWATSLTTLTRVPPCLPNTGDGGVEVGWVARGTLKRGIKFSLQRI